MVNRLGQYEARLKVIACEGAARCDLGLILDFRERDLDARSEFAPLLVCPSPRSPASSEDGKKTQRTARVPIENCLTVGVQSNDTFTLHPRRKSNLQRRRSRRSM